MSSASQLGRLVQLFIEERTLVEAIQRCHKEKASLEQALWCAEFPQLFTSMYTLYSERITHNASRLISVQSEIAFVLANVNPPPPKRIRLG